MGSSPPLNEESFTRLLAAAYVMQEHRNRQTGKPAPSGFTHIVSQIVETQHLLQSGKLILQPALDLICARLQKVSGASGAAIVILEAGRPSYKAACGSARTLIQSIVPKGTALSSHCLRTGENLLSPLAESDPRLDTVLMRQIGAKSFVAVPIRHEGKIAGVLEVFFSEARGFGEVTVRTCELMAGLTSEVIGQAAQEKLNQEMAAERASVVGALQRLRPQLQKVAGRAEPLRKSIESAATGNGVCRVCGHTLAASEPYCTFCGELAETHYSELPGKWTTLWQREFAKGEQGTAESVPPKKGERNADASNQIPASRGIEVLGDETEVDGTESQTADQDAEAKVAIENCRTLLHPVETVEVFANSPSSVREWLTEQLDQGWLNHLKKWTTGHRGDISLAVSVVVFMTVLIWGIWSIPSSSSVSTKDAHGVAQVSRKRKAPKPQLTTFDKLLVGLGLAVPPPAPVELGDPNVKVWVDLRTALYYCPGTDLYGTTPKGKFTSQGDAQQDQYEPAYRKACY